jgi:hypothetical protein
VSSADELAHPTAYAAHGEYLEETVTQDEILTLLESFLPE